MLLDKEVVGNTAEHFAIEYEVLMSNDDRVIKDFHTAVRTVYRYLENMSKHVLMMSMIRTCFTVCR
jgi:adenylate kinase